MAWRNALQRCLADFNAILAILVYIIGDTNQVIFNIIAALWLLWEPRP